MGSIGDPITQPIPPVGTAGTLYASELDAFMAEVKTRLEALVPLSSLNPGPFQLSNSPLLNASYVSLYPQIASPTTPADSLQCYNNDLWWVGSGSNYVQITSGGTINAAGVGGITGDYGGVNPAQFRYVTADGEYYAYTNYGTTTAALVWAGGFDIKDSGSANRLKLRYASADTYTLTLPDKPGAAAFLQMGTTGTVTASSTITTNVTAPDFRYTTAQDLIIPVSAAHLADSAYAVGSYWLTSASGAVTSCTLITGHALTFPIPCRSGDTITGYTLYYHKTSDNTKTISGRLYQVDASSGAETGLGAGSTDATNAPAYAHAITESGLSVAPSDGFQFYFVASNTNGVTGDQVLHLVVNIKRS